jgi:ATP-dependent exoDNAse (exonuclease V) beta subunit
LYAVDVETARSDSSLILAAARPRAASREPLESFVRQLERRRMELESARLLYVATTRAREQLHLLGHVPALANNGKGETQREVHAPERPSLLDVLWPAVRRHFEEAPGREAPVAARPATAQAPKPLILRRLVSDWRQPAVGGCPLATRADARAADQEPRPAFDWVTEISRLVGVEVHRDLERRVRVRIQSRRTLDVDRSLYRTELRELGVPPEHVAAAVERVADAVTRLLADDRGRWLLAPHADESIEWALTAEIDGEVRQLVIDRSFVDDDGTRWIIDYKTSTHAGGALEEFLASEEERYAPQLARYASVVRRLAPGPVRAALYFPLLGAWRELRQLTPDTS